MRHDSENILDLAKSQANELRRLITFLESDEFREVYEAATPEQKRLVAHWVKIKSYTNVYGWYKETAVVQLRLYHLTVKELRRLAARYKIQDYQYLRQWELIDELTQKLQ